MLPLNADGQLPRARHRFDDNIALGHAAGEQLGLGAFQERVDDFGVPSCMHNADAQAGAVVLLGGGALHGGGGGGLGSRGVSAKRAGMGAQLSELWMTGEAD